MNERYSVAAATQPLRNTPAEPRTVYRHDCIRAKRADLSDGFAHAPKYDGSARQHLRYTHDCQVLERLEALQPLVPHSLAADAGDPQPVAETLPERADQRAAKRVP